MKKISDEYTSVRKSLTVYGSISGNYSFRGEKTIWFESTLERDFLCKQDYDRNVVDVVGQPISIPYVTQLGNLSTYTPDFLVQYASAIDDLGKFFCAPLLVEIKPRSKIIQNWDQLKPKFLAAKNYAVKRGWRFKIVDESRIYDQYWNNLLFLKKFKRSIVDENVKKAFLTILTDIGKAKIIDVLSSSSFESKNIRMLEVSIWILIAKKNLVCDLTTPLNSETFIWINQESFLGDK